MYPTVKVLSPLTMTASNSTSIQNTQFVVLCFPGDWSWWKGLLGAGLILLFLVALFANLSLLLLIWTEWRLHTPMYYFVCCLCLLDSALCSIVGPIALTGLLFGVKTINASTCFIQVYFITSLVSLQSGVLMVMAYDRYVAIRKPLQYLLIMSNNFMFKAFAALFLRSCILLMPLTVLPSQLNYCVGNVIQGCFCNSLQVAIHACDSNPIIGIYNLITTVLYTGFDTSFITFSYFMIIRAVLQLPSRGASSKAFNTCGSHFILISYFSISKIVLVIANIYRDIIPMNLCTLLAVLFCLIPPVLDPIVYGLRTKGFMQSIMTKLKMFKLLSNVPHFVSNAETLEYISKPNFETRD